MRLLTSKENRKRGCEWCLDHRWFKSGYVKRNHACLHETGCPYHELDKYETYDDYLKHARNEGMDKLLDAVFRLQRDL